MDQVKKRPKKIFDRRSVFFSAVILVMFGYIVYNQLNILKTTNGKMAGESGENIYRELGNKLKSEKLYDLAISAYKKYAENPELSPEIKSNMYYMIGELYFEKHNFEEALSAYYTADLLGSAPNIANDLNIRIVNCLERLGRDFSAEYALQSRSSVNSDKKSQPEGIIVAKFGNETITMRDLDEKLEMLDEESRKEFRNPQKKLMFLHQYLAMELLARKAQKMGYDRDADILTKLDDVKKQFMVEKMVQAEFNNKVSITPEDIKLYYEANKDKYDKPAAVKATHILVDSYEKAEELKGKIQNGANFGDIAKTESKDSITKDSGGLIQDWIYPGMPASTGINYSEIASAALEKEIGEITDIIQDSQGYHIVKVMDKRPAEKQNFEQVANLVARDYQTFKMQKLYSDMMENIFKVENVKIFETEFLPSKQE